MEFLKALENAKQQGISQEDFVRIWDTEMKLKQQQEETRQLELKLSGGNVQDSGKNIKDQVRSILHNHLTQIQQQISELTVDLQHHIDAHFQEMSQQLKSQAAATAMVIRNELEDVLRQYTSGGHNVFSQQAPTYTYPAYHQPTGDAQASGYGMDSFQQQSGRRNDTSPDSWNLLPKLDKHQNNECIFPSENGAIMCVHDLDQLISSGKMEESVVYLLSECQAKVQLSIWFSKKGNFNAQLAVFGDQALRCSRIFTVNGSIENKSSGSYSPLFEGNSQPLKKLKPVKKMLVHLPVCLHTGKGVYDNVTYEELEKRNYVIDDSLIIKWFVTSEEVQD